MNKRITIKYSLLQAGYWTLAAVAMAYTTPILEAKGFDSMQIGILSAVKYISVILFQMIIGSFSDKYAHKIPMKYIIAFLSVISMGAAGLLWVSDNNMIIGIIVFTLFGATVNCISPLVDSLSIQYMNHGVKMNYTVSRACGSGAWAVFCVVVGMISDAFGANNILLFQLMITVLFIAVNMWMERVDFSVTSDKLADENDRVHQKDVEEIKRSIQEPHVHSMKYLLTRYPKYTMYLIGCVFMFMGYNMNATFLVNVIENLGGNHTDYGMAQFTLAMAEVPVAIFFYKLKSKISIDKLMVICAVFCTFRAAATTFAPTVLLVILSQAFEILGLAIFYPGTVFFVMDYLPVDDAVKGTSLVNLASMGLGEALGSIVSGSMKKAYGLEVLMNASIFVSMVAIFIMVVMVKMPAENLNKKLKIS